MQAMTPGVSVPGARYRKPLLLAGLTLTAYVAAINRDQSLPWAIAALLLATLITGFAWPHWLMKRLSVSRTGPERAEEGETVHFRVEVRNEGWLPRFMVEVVDGLPFVGAATGTAGSGERTLGVVDYVGGNGN